MTYAPVLVTTQLHNRKAYIAFNWKAFLAGVGGSLQRAPDPLIRADSPMHGAPASPLQVVAMSSSWRSLYRGYHTPSSESADKLGIRVPRDLEEKVRHLVDVLLINDLKEEYYYSQIDVALDAFRAHKDVVDEYPDLYREIINMLRPMMLDCQKVLASAYLWDRGIDKSLALDLLRDVRPSWKLTFFYIFRKQVPEMGLKHKGLGRSLKRLAKEVIESCPPFYLIKYRRKLLPIARWIHLKPVSIQSKFIFRDYKKDPNVLRELTEYDELIRDYFELKRLVSEASKEDLLAFLRKTRLPFTIIKGILGSKINDPDIYAACIHTMTVWETLLSLRQLEDRGLLDISTVYSLVKDKLLSSRLMELKIDLVELMQAYRAVKTEKARELLRYAITSQIGALAEAIGPYIEDKKVAVVFDVSGSMAYCADWSLALALALSRVKTSGMVLVAFASYASTIPVPRDIDEAIELMSKIEVGGMTALGLGLKVALEHDPDIVLVISDFEQNTPPWSNEVYRDYVKEKGRKPTFISIKITNSPKLSVGEITALRTGRWLGIPDEHKIVIRNLWDLPKLLEATLKVIPKIRELAKQQQ